MTRNKILGALASIALVASGTATAHPGKGAGKSAGVSAKAKGGPKAKAQSRAPKAKAQSRSVNAAGGAARVKGRANSQGPAHASARALERANANSVLAGGRVVEGPLTGLAAGTPVQFDNGALGVVERITPSSGGNARNVLVRLSDGRIVPLRPSRLSETGGVWTATSRR